MNAKRIFLPVALFCASLCMFHCTKKDSADGIKPTFGSTGNQNPSNNTVTGVVTYTNPATENTTMWVGGDGWSNPTCATTHSVMLQGIDDNIEVTLSFNGLIKSGVYAVTTNPTGSNQCSMTVLNPVGQPTGIAWYGRSGSVTVTTTSANISAKFKDIICTQKTFNFPTVTIHGDLACGQ